MAKRLCWKSGGGHLVCVCVGAQLSQWPFNLLGITHLLSVEICHRSSYIPQVFYSFQHNIASIKAYLVGI